MVAGAAAAIHLVARCICPVFRDIATHHEVFGGLVLSFRVICGSRPREARTMDVAWGSPVIVRIPHIADASVAAETGGIVVGPMTGLALSMPRESTAHIIRISVVQIHGKLMAAGTEIIHCGLGISGRGRGLISSDCETINVNVVQEHPLEIAAV